MRCTELRIGGDDGRALLALTGSTFPALTLFPLRRDTDATLSALTTLTQSRKRRSRPGANPSQQYWRFRYLRKYRRSSSEEYTWFEPRAMCNRS
jgi:hypothetical protein